MHMHCHHSSANSSENNAKVQLTIHFFGNASTALGYQSHLDHILCALYCNFVPCVCLVNGTRIRNTQSSISSWATMHIVTDDIIANCACTDPEPSGASDCWWWGPCQHKTWCTYIVNLAERRIRMYKFPTVPSITDIIICLTEHGPALHII